MADGSSTLARIQGQGLVETTTKDAELGGAALAVTPAGAEMQGRGPDSVKMAGTQPSKVNALRVAMQDVGSRRLGALREMARPELKEDARVSVLRNASVLGRIDESMSAYINKTLQAAFTQNILAKENQGAKLKSTVYSKEDTKRNSLLVSIAKLNSTTATGVDLDNAIKIINDALASVGAGAVKLTKDTPPSTNAQLIATNLFENLTPEQMTKGFADSVAKAKKSIQIDDFLKSDDAKLFAEGNGLTNTEALKALIASIVPKDSDLSKMELGDLTSAIQTWRQENFKDVSEYQKTLADPGASYAQRQLALENLRRLGKVGVLAADQKVGDLDAQMQDGDVVNIDNEQFEISEFFTAPEKLAQLKGWLDKPATAPASLKTWIETNRDAIQNKVNEISPDLQKLANTVETNMQTLKLPDNVQLDSGTAEFFFGDLTKPTIAAKTVPDKYKLLQDATTGPVMITLLNRLKTIGNGLDGKLMFKNLTVDQLKTIVNTGSVEQYVDNAIKQKRALDFLANLPAPAPAEAKASTAQTIDEKTFANSFRLLLSDRGLNLEDAGISISRLAGKNLGEFADIFKQAGLSDLLAEGKLNITTLKAKIKDFADGDANSLISGDTFNTLKEYLNNKVMGGIRNALSQPTLNPDWKKMPGSAKERDSLFQKSKNERNPKDVLAEKENLRNTIGGENHNNWEDYKNKRNAYPSEAAFFRNTPTEYRDSSVYLDRYSVQIEAHAAAEKKWEESQARFDAANNDWNSYRDNLPQTEKDYRDRFNAWFDEYQSTMNTDNDNLQKRYTRLSNIIGGMG